MGQRVASRDWLESAAVSELSVTLSPSLPLPSVCLSYRDIQYLFTELKKKEEEGEGKKKTDGK